jgi:hypothetical protein
MTTIAAGTTLTNSYTVNTDTTGNLVLQTNGGTTALTIDTNQNATVANSVSMAGNLTVTGKSTHVGSAVFNNTISVPNTFGFKNRIINGGMVINQRNTTISSQGYSVDRFGYYASQVSKATVAQSTTAPTGFNNSLLVTSSSAYTVGASEIFEIYQFIEGYNIADLSWGTANAKTVTLSFWVQSSLTGTFGGSLLNSAANRCYVYSYSIPVANTWTQISITIAGDTSGTWETTTNAGIQVIWGLGVGSTKSGTTGSWGSTAYYSATGATSVVGTSGATFYLTGVQLEVGTQATAFDYRPYGTELQLCQRYYAKQKSGTNVNDLTNFGSGLFDTSTTSWQYIKLTTTMRATPTVTQSNCSINDVTTITTPVTGLVNIWAGQDSLTLKASVASGGTANRPCFICSYFSTSAYIDFSAEL